MDHPDIVDIVYPEEIRQQVNEIMKYQNLISCLKLGKHYDEEVAQLGYDESARYDPNDPDLEPNMARIIRYKEFAIDLNEAKKDLNYSTEEIDRILLIAKELVTQIEESDIQLIKSFAKDIQSVWAVLKPKYNDLFNISE